MYLLLFENMKENCISRLKSFFQDIKIINGEARLVINEKYKEIENKKFNGKKNIFLATMDWFAENEAINQDEFQILINIRNDRNKISHELLNLLYNDCDEDMVKNFLKCIEIYKKIDKWWILNIEIPISGEFNPDEVLENEVISGNWLMLSIIMDNIYGSNSYKKIIDEIKNINTN